MLTIETRGQVSEGQVVEMNRRLAATEQSLSAPMHADGEAEWQDMLAAGSCLAQGLEALNARERHILEGRRLERMP